MYRQRPRPLVLALLLTLICGGLPAAAATPAPALPAADRASLPPAVRVQVDQKGDFILIGNTLAQECASGTPLPIAGVIGNCGTNTADTAPDVFWRADSPTAGGAEANTIIAPGQARSTALLALPPGARVTHAYLYWAATLAAPGTDTTAVIDRPGAFTAPVTAIQSLSGANNSYRSVADVTALVRANGPGAYRVSGVNSVSLVNLNNSNVFASWWMVVLYERDSEPLRNLIVYDGLDEVTSANPQNITLSGFLVPSAGINGKLGVVALEGDNASLNDALAFNGTILTNNQNPANDFFNSTRSFLGSPVSVQGDLPQLNGGPQSMGGIDLDVVDVTPYLAAGQTSASLAATSAGDVYHLATFVTSLSTYRPLFASSAKSVTDLNGGAIQPGDLLEYAMTVANTGNDTAIQTILTDPLPLGLTYEPGSIIIAAGPNAGPKTDLPGDDQAEYLPATHRIIARLGAGADASQGGQLAVNGSTEIRFRARVGSDCAGPAAIANQAVIDAGGLVGAPRAITPTDGDPSQPGAQPTVLNIDFRCLSVGKIGQGAVASVPAGIDCGADCLGAFAAGVPLTLTATPAAGYQFSGWSGAAGGGANPLSLTITATTAITATFVQLSYPLSVSISGVGAASIASQPGGISCPGDCGESFAATTPVTLAISLGPQTRLIGWGGACSGSQPVCVVTMDQARTVTAAIGPPKLYLPQVFAPARPAPAQRRGR